MKTGIIFLVISIIWGYYLFRLFFSKNEKNKNKISTFSEKQILFFFLFFGVCVGVTVFSFGSIFFENKSHLLHEYMKNLFYIGFSFFLLGFLVEAMSYLSYLTKKPFKYKFDLVKVGIEIQIISALGFLLTW